MLYEVITASTRALIGLLGKTVLVLVVGILSLEIVKSVMGNEILKDVVERVEAVITSYSIHYTKLYDRSQGQGGSLSHGRQGAG